ncbi:MAG: iron-containing alcohol dehydrogenase, partial [Propionicimonas sp.]
LLGAPHGAITAAVMVAVSEHNIAALTASGGEAAVARYAEVGELLTGRRDPAAFTAWFAATAAELGVTGLSGLGLAEAAIDEVAQAAAKASSTKGNPVPMSGADLAAVLRRSL